MTTQMLQIMARALRRVGGRALGVAAVLTVAGACHLLDVVRRDLAVRGRDLGRIRRR